MKKILFLVTIALMMIGVQASAEAVKMTGDDIRQTLIGNSSQYDTPWGFAEMFRDPDGAYYVRNSRGERGKGTWTIEDDQFCIKWTETYRDWRTSNSCTGFTKIDDSKVETSNGTIHKVRQGDPTKVKPKE